MKRITSFFSKHFKSITAAVLATLAVFAVVKKRGS